MPVEEHLTPKEKIEAELETSDNYEFYATNKRIIKYKKGFSGEHMEDLMYKHITSVELFTQNHYSLIFVGIFFIFFGYLLQSIKMPYLNYFLYFVGLILIILGIFVKDSGYRFHASGVDPANWTIQVSNPNSKEVINFVKVVREHIEIEKE